MSAFKISRIRTAFVLLLLGCTTTVAAQGQDFNHWSVEGAVGANKALNPYSSGYSSNSICFPAAEIGGRYMFNSYAGIRMEAGYCQMKYDHFGTVEQSGYFKTNYGRLTVEGVLNLGQILDFYSIHPRLGLLGYAGVGISSLWNDSLKVGVKNGSDEMMHFTIGFSPQYRLNDRLTLSLNLRTLFHMYESRTFDMRTQIQDRGLDGYLLTATVGVNYYLGAAKTHIDWYDETPVMLDRLQRDQSRYDSIVAAMKDDDRDGVPNVRDEEPATAAGATVTVKGVTVVPEEAVAIRTDDEENIEGYVEFPDKKGLFFTIQVGTYKESTDPEKRYGLSPLMKTTILDSETRYLYGIYGQLSDAQQMKDVVFERGVKDAFVAAYYQGKRITIAHAQQLLLTHGRIILEPSR